MISAIRWLLTALNMLDAILIMDDGCSFNSNGVEGIKSERKTCTLITACMQKCLTNTVIKRLTTFY